MIEARSVLGAVVALLLATSLRAQEAGTTPPPAALTDAALAELVERLRAELAAFDRAPTAENLVVVERSPEEAAEDLFEQQKLFFPESYYPGIHAFLRALELRIPSDVDEFRSAVLSGYGANLLAYFDPVSLRLSLLRRPEGPLEGALEPVLAHELVHAWQEERRGFVPELVRGGRTLDQVRVSHCLLEGEADLVALATLAGRSGRTLADFPLGGPENQVGALLTDPSVNRIYATGRSFLHGRWLADGWSAVDAAFVARPLSTEQMLHPAKLDLDAPSVVLLPPPLSGLEVIHEDVLGELALRGFFEALGEAEAAEIAAIGWDGDRLRVYGSGDSRFVVWRSVWDREEDAVQVIEHLPRNVRRNTERRGAVIDFVAGRPKAIADKLREALHAWPAPTADPRDAASTEASEAEALGLRGRAEEGLWLLPKLGIALRGPTGWEPREHNGVAVLIREGEESFRDNFTAIALPNDEGLDLDQLVEQNRAVMQGASGLEWIGAEEFAIPLGAARLMRYGMKATDRTPPLRFAALLFLLGEQQVVVTASIDAERWDELEASLRAALSTVDRLPATARGR